MVSWRIVEALAASPCFPQDIKSLYLTLKLEWREGAFYSVTPRSDVIDSLSSGTNTVTRKVYTVA